MGTRTGLVYCKTYSIRVTLHVDIPEGVGVATAGDEVEEGEDVVGGQGADEGELVGAGAGVAEGVAAALLLGERLLGQLPVAVDGGGDLGPALGGGGRAAGRAGRHVGDAVAQAEPAPDERLVAAPLGGGPGVVGPRAAADLEARGPEQGYFGFVRAGLGAVAVVEQLVGAARAALQLRHQVQRAGAQDVPLDRRGGQDVARRRHGEARDLGVADGALVGLDERLDVLGALVSIVN